MRVRIDASLSLVRYASGQAPVARWSIAFALPTAVAGISLTAIYAGNGWLGQYLEPLGIKIAFAPAGILVALVFIGLPFVVRTVQPILEDLEVELEEAAASLGANRWETFSRVIFPLLLPALLTGFALAFARAVGEYGSVIFIAGNLPMISEITPLIIITKLEQYDYVGATAIAPSCCWHPCPLFIINALQAWTARRTGETLIASASRDRARRQGESVSRSGRDPRPPWVHGRSNRSLSAFSRSSFSRAVRVREPSARVPTYYRLSSSPIPVAIRRP